MSRNALPVVAGLFWFLVAAAGLRMAPLWAVLSALLLGAAVRGVLNQLAKQPAATREE